jgi:hypothetical protein
MLPIAGTWIRRPLGDAGNHAARFPRCKTDNRTPAMALFHPSRRPLARIWGVARSAWDPMHDARGISRFQTITAAPAQACRFRDSRANPAQTSVPEQEMRIPGQEWRVDTTSPSDIAVGPFARWDGHQRASRRQSPREGIPVTYVPRSAPQRRSREAEMPVPQGQWRGSADARNGSEQEFPRGATHQVSEEHTRQVVKEPVSCTDPSLGKAVPHLGRAS